jgi:hypothetical protein
MLYTPYGIYHLQPYRMEYHTFTLVCTTLNQYIPCHVPKKPIYIMGQGQVKTVYTVVYNSLTTVYTMVYTKKLVYK